MYSIIRVKSFRLVRAKWRYPSIYWEVHALCNKIQWAKQNFKRETELLYEVEKIEWIMHNLGTSKENKKVAYTANIVYSGKWDTLKYCKLGTICHLQSILGHTDEIKGPESWWIEVIPWLESLGLQNPKRPNKRLNNLHIGMIDAKGIDVAQPIWSWGCPT